MHNTGGDLIDLIGRNSEMSVRSDTVPVGVEQNFIVGKQSRK